MKASVMMACACLLRVGQWQRISVTPITHPHPLRPRVVKFLDGRYTSAGKTNKR